MGALIAGAQESKPRIRRAHDANTSPGVQLISSAQRRLCFTAHWIRLDRPNRRMSTTPAIWPPGMNDSLNFSSLARAGRFANRVPDRPVLSRVCLDHPSGGGRASTRRRGEPMPGRGVRQRTHISSPCPYSGSLAHAEGHDTSHPALKWNQACRWSYHWSGTTIRRTFATGLRMPSSNFCASLPTLFCSPVRPSRGGAGNGCCRAGHGGRHPATFAFPASHGRRSRLDSRPSGLPGGRGGSQLYQDTWLA